MTQSFADENEGLADDVAVALRYAVRRGIASDEIIDKAEALTALHANDPARRKTILELANMLAIAIRPATIDGLKFVDTNTGSLRSRPWPAAIWGAVKGTPILWTQRWFRIHTLLVFFLLLILQIYATSSSYLLDNLAKAQSDYDAVASEVSRLVAAEGTAHRAKKYPELYKKKDDAEFKMKSASNLVEWLYFMPLGLMQKAMPSSGANERLDCSASGSGVEESAKAAEEREVVCSTIPSRLRSITELLSKYFLPIIYGWLGACIFVVRRLIVQIDESSFMPKERYKHRLKILLGIVLGGVVSLFIPAGSMSSLDLSLAAVAFLAGYNVEVVFSMLDTIVEKLQKSVSSKGTA